MKKILPAALALVLVFCLAQTGCGEKKQADSNVIRIGVAAPLTGGSAQDGQSILDGVKLAVQQFNDAGGVDGTLIEVVAEDDKGDPTEGATVANKLAQDASIVAVIGHYNSSCTLAGAPIYNGAGVVEISPGSSAAAVTDAGEYTFRVITTDAVQGADLCDWAVNGLGYSSIAILYENTDYGLGLAEVVENSAGPLGAAIVVKEAYEVGATDFSTVLTKIAASGADVLFIGGLYNETALIAKQRADYGLAELPIMGVDAIFSNALIELGGDAVEGILLTGYFSDSSESAVTQNFIATYQSVYGEMPGTYAAYGYDAALCVLDAIKTAGADRASIQKHLASLKDFEGATGTITFDENGDAIKQPLHLVIKGGKFSLYEG